MRSKQKRIKTSHRLSSTDQTGFTVMRRCSNRTLNAGMWESSRIVPLDLGASDSPLPRIAAIPIKMT